MIVSKIQILIIKIHSFSNNLHKSVNALLNFFLRSFIKEAIKSETMVLTTHKLNKMIMRRGNCFFLLCIFCLHIWGTKDRAIGRIGGDDDEKRTIGHGVEWVYCPENNQSSRPSKYPSFILTKKKQNKFQKITLP